MNEPIPITNAGMSADLQVEFTLTINGKGKQISQIINAFTLPRALGDGVHGTIADFPKIFALLVTNPCLREVEQVLKQAVARHHAKQMAERYPSGIPAKPELPTDIRDVCHDEQAA